MKIQLEHANLTVESISEAKRFLRAAFPDFRTRGGGNLHDNPDLGRWEHFGNDETYLALQENSQHISKAEVRYLNDGINHLGFVVEQLESLMDRMNDAGYAITEVSDLNGHPHRRRAYYIDGNGFEWEFVEYLSAKVEERNDYTR